ncbi:MAG: biopolymer transporter ExbD [Rhodocyclaceae bacterium]|jgi:biopolymer transport protein ExbD|nr:biopolymer transporter ExbD [Rhodocyclaceae bacterium]
MNFRRGAGRDEPEINLIPFIDVLLVIIIFLMMTTTYSKVSGIEIDLPTAAASNQTPPDEVMVTVTASGTVVVDGQSLSRPTVDTVAAALKQAAQRKGASKPPVVSINADAKATHQSVIDVMQAAHQADLSQISFATRNGS